MRPAPGADNSAAKVVPSVKVRKEAQHLPTPLCVLDLLRETFTFYDSRPIFRTRNIVPLLNNFMNQISYWEADSSSAIEAIPRIL